MPQEAILDFFLSALAVIGATLVVLAIVLVAVIIWAIVFDWKDSRKK